jgi:hypothetical protein
MVRGWLMAILRILSFETLMVARILSWIEVDNSIFERSLYRSLYRAGRVVLVWPHCLWVIDLL